MVNSTINGAKTKYNYLWAGDLRPDGRVIYQGPNTDVFQLFLQVISDPDNVTGPTVDQTPTISFKDIYKKITTWMVFRFIKDQRMIEISSCLIQFFSIRVMKIPLLTSLC